MSDHLEGVVGVILHVYVVISVIGYILDILDFYGITDLIIVENLVTIAVIYYFVGVLEKFVNERERNIRIIGEKNQVVNETNALLEERQYYIEQLNEELKQQAEVLTDQSKQLMQKNKDLETLNKTKDKFLSILAHDLKNPFNILLGFSTILETKFEKLTDTKKLEFIKIIGSASKKTYNLLENLLQWTRSQSKTIEFHPQKLVIESAISENLNFFREMLKNKEIELTYLACNGSFVYADEKMINTVIRNLLSNAIKFTPNKGKINVSCKQTDQRVYVEITDNGIGMNKESVDSLFRIDKRNIAIGTDGETGSGLGLLLCKDFIEKNHGEIWATGEPEKGSTFSFFLPVFEEPDV